MMTSFDLDENNDEKEQDVIKLLKELKKHEPLDPSSPMLDREFLSRISSSFVHIMNQKNARINAPILGLLRNWCSISSESCFMPHSTWLSRNISVPEISAAMLTACSPIFEECEFWKKIPTNHRLALSGAVLAIATSRSAVPDFELSRLCTLILSRTLRINELDEDHCRFLAKMWDERDLLQISIQQLSQLIKKAPLGLEKDLLYLGHKALENPNCDVKDVLENFSVPSLVSVCCQSPDIFQTASSILTHMMINSNGHFRIRQLIQHFVKRIEEECRKNGSDICTLYPSILLLPSSLMAVDPSLLPESAANSTTLSRKLVIEICSNLPSEMVLTLLLHNPSWARVF